MVPVLSHVRRFVGRGCRVTCLWAVCVTQTQAVSVAVAVAVPITTQLARYGLYSSLTIRASVYIVYYAPSSVASTGIWLCISRFRPFV